MQQETYPIPLKLTTQKESIPHCIPQVNANNCIFINQCQQTISHQRLRTRTRHGDDHIQIDLQVWVDISVNTKLIIRPSPEKLAHVIEEQ